MSEVIMVLEEPWYNTLTEQMFEQVIEEIQPEPFIVSSELDNEITNRYKNDKSNCPCSLIRDEDTVCMCKEFREMEEGTCHCQLYVKTKE